MKNKSQNRYILLPAILIFALLPAFILGSTYNSELTDFAWHSQQTLKADYFLLCKMTLFLICSAYMLIILIYKLATQRHELKFTKDFLPLFIYAFLCILSTIFANNRSIALSGADDMFENIFVLLGYVIVTYYVANTVDTEQAAKTLFYSFLIGTGIVFTIGAFQAFGLDPFASKLVRGFLASTIDGLRAEDISIAMKGATFSTLYNPNYNGVFVSMALPIFLVFLLLSKGIKQKLLYLFLTAISVIFLYGSRSNAAFLVVGVLVLMVVFFLRKTIFKYWYVAVPVFAIFIATFFIVNAVRGNIFLNEIKNSLQITAEEPKALSHIDAGDECIDICYKGENLKVYMITDANDNFADIIFKDSDSNILESSIDTSTLTYTIADKRFPFAVTPFIYTDLLFPVEDGWENRDAISLQFTIDGMKWAFTYDTVNETYYYITVFGKCDKTFDAPSALFTNHPSLFTRRGFIWSKTIPLLKDSIFLGYGPDNFVTVFPHNDYVDYNLFGFAGSIMTKPHCLYLQVATQTGILSLLALLTFFVMYFISSLKTYFKNDFTSFSSKLGVAILIAVCGYLITGLTNDSMLVTSPVFYCLLGLGIALNGIVKKETEVKEKC